MVISITKCGENSSEAVQLAVIRALLTITTAEHFVAHGESLMQAVRLHLFDIWPFFILQVSGFQILSVLYHLLALLCLHCALWLGTCPPCEASIPAC